MPLNAPCLSGGEAVVVFQEVEAKKTSELFIVAAREESLTSNPVFPLTLAEFEELPSQPTSADDEGELRVMSRDSGEKTNHEVQKACCG